MKMVPIFLALSLFLAIGVAVCIHAQEQRGHPVRRVSSGPRKDFSRLNPALIPHKLSGPPRRVNLTNGEPGGFSTAMTAREAFERGTKTFNAHDIKGFAEVLADEVVFEAPGGLRGEGKAASVEFFGSWFVAFPDAHVDVHNVHIPDNVAVEEGTFTGTHNGVLRGPMGDVPPTGRSVRIRYIQVLRFQDGKHVSFNLMFDRLSMLERLGLIPAPPASR